MNNKNLKISILVGVAVIAILGAGGYLYLQSIQPTKAPVVVLPKTTTPSLANQPETTQPTVSPNQAPTTTPTDTSKAPISTPPTNTSTGASNTPKTPTTSAATPNLTGTNNGSGTPTVSTSAYKDGQYSANGNYVSPGGAQSLDLTATIKEGKIAQIQMTSKATDAKSERYQNAFKDGVSGIIVGKSLDDNLDPGTVNGSSLTHKGFVQAIEAIKIQASK